MLLRAAHGLERWFGLRADAELPQIAAAIRVLLGGVERPPREPMTELVGQLGWRIETRQLSARADGLKAMLAPLIKGGFVILVDPEPSPSERLSGLSPADVVELRIAHEVGHALFYEPGAPPMRRSMPCGAEEAFCDDLAAALVGDRRRRT